MFPLVVGTRISFRALLLTGARLAAKAALRRKNQFERALEQTNDQILMLEREVSSIETANINKETLEAIKKASNAMKRIHGGLTVDKIDQTMEELREQVRRSKTICDYGY